MPSQCLRTTRYSLRVTRRHVSSWFDATAQERQELTDAVIVASEAIRQKGKIPDGFNNGGGLQYLAELGVPLCLADELTMTSLGNNVDRANITIADTNGKVSIISSAVITGAPTTPPPFRTYRFTTTATMLTVATMLGITNDSFGAVTIHLPSKGDSVDAVANSWDAGSECNDEQPTHTGPFASQHPHDCAGEGTVSISNGFHNVNHPANVGPSGTPGNIDWRNPVFAIHVTASKNSEAGDPQTKSGQGGI